jgi:polyphosphate glucokinase
MAEVASSELTTLAVDIGGTGIKVLLLDGAGNALTERVSAPTPKPATPGAVIDTIAFLASKVPPFDRLAVGFPGVVRRGVTLTAPNLDQSWKGFELEVSLEQLLLKPVRVANDADVQGFGAIEGTGVELVLTLGTGVGSALFVDGILVPNLELPHHPFEEGRTYEQLLGQAALQAAGDAVWKERLSRAIVLLRNTFNFTTLFLGGGNSRKLAQQSMPDDVKITPNIAGLLGGIALWTGVDGTSLVRAPHAHGASSPIERTRGIELPND